MAHCYPESVLANWWFYCCPLFLWQDVVFLRATAGHRARILALPPWVTPCPTLLLPATPDCFVFLILVLVLVAVALTDQCKQACVSASCSIAGLNSWLLVLWEFDFFLFGTLGGCGALGSRLIDLWAHRSCTCLLVCRWLCHCVASAAAPGGVT